MGRCWPYVDLRSTPQLGDILDILTAKHKRLKFRGGHNASTYHTKLGLIPVLQLSKKARELESIIMRTI